MNKHKITERDIETSIGGRTLYAVHASVSILATAPKEYTPTFSGARIFRTTYTNIWLSGARNHPPNFRTRWYLGRATPTFALPVDFRKSNTHFCKDLKMFSSALAFGASCTNILVTGPLPISERGILGRGGNIQNS